jgi:hypothetical protein
MVENVKVAFVNAHLPIPYEREMHGTHYYSIEFILCRAACVINLNVSRL